MSVSTNDTAALSVNTTWSAPRVVLGLYDPVYIPKMLSNRLVVLSSGEWVLSSRSAPSSALQSLEGARIYHTANKRTHVLNRTDTRKETHDRPHREPDCRHGRSCRTQGNRRRARRAGR